MIVRVKSRGRNATGRSRARDRWSKTASRPPRKKKKRVRAAGERVIDFGQYQGKRYADIPIGYLRWMIRVQCKDWHRARMEIQRRRWSDRERTT